MIDHCTIVIITHHHEQALKQHLSAINKLAKDLKASVLIVDQDSFDDGYTYISTHFPTINIRKEAKAQSQQQILNNIIAVSESSHLLFINIECRIQQLDSNTIRAAMEDSCLYSLKFPITFRYQAGKRQTIYGLELHKRGFNKLELIKKDSKNTQSISDIMLLNTAPLRKMGGLSTEYNSILYTFFDAEAKAKELGYTSRYASTASHIEKKAQHDSFLCYPADESQLLEDAWIYQFTHNKGVLNKVKTIFLIFQSLFTLKPQHLWALFKVCLFNSWRLPSVKRRRKHFLSVENYHEAAQHDKLSLLLLSKSPQQWENWINEQSDSITLGSSFSLRDLIAGDGILIDKALLETLSRFKRILYMGMQALSINNIHIVNKEFEAQQASEKIRWKLRLQD